MTHTPLVTERRQPGLSETLTGPKAPNSCQSCANISPDGEATGLRYWIECDEWDRPTKTVVVLCEQCTDRLIAPHARLYHCAEPNQPLAGCMPHLCTDCLLRAGTRCTHPALKENGGTGLTVHITPPITAFLCGRGHHRGPRKIWQHAATSCDGRLLVAHEVAP